MKQTQIKEEDYDCWWDWYNDYLDSDQYTIDIKQVNKDREIHEAKVSEILLSDNPNPVTEEEEAIMNSLYTDLMKKFDRYESIQRREAEQMFDY